MGRDVPALVDEKVLADTGCVNQTSTWQLIFKDLLGMGKNIRIIFDAGSPGPASLMETTVTVKFLIVRIRIVNDERVIQHGSVLCF